MKSRQMNLFQKPSLEHGGGLRKDRRKSIRPIDTKRPMHLVLRSSRAKGRWSFLHQNNVNRVSQIIRESGKHFDVKVYRSSNVGNHLHLLVKARSRRDFQGFLRVLSGAIVFAITGCKKGKPVPNSLRTELNSSLESSPKAENSARKFWDALAYSRVVSWGREFTTLEKYIGKNILEAEWSISAEGLQVLARGG